MQGLRTGERVKELDAREISLPERSSMLIEQIFTMITKR